MASLNLAKKSRQEPSCETLLRCLQEEHLKGRLSSKKVAELNTCALPQAFLKERAIDLDQSCCLIRQAHVTQLADNNSTSTPLHVLSVGYHAFVSLTSSYAPWLDGTSRPMQVLNSLQR